MGALARKAVCLLLLALFLHAVMLNGFTPPNAHTAPGSRGRAELITFDVCGHHAPANAVSQFELTADVHESLVPVFLIDREFPPMPDTAAPSAEPGEVEHPPQA